MTCGTRVHPHPNRGVTGIRRRQGKEGSLGEPQRWEGELLLMRSPLFPANVGPQQVCVGVKKSRAVLALERTGCLRASFFPYRKIKELVLLAHAAKAGWGGKVNSCIQPCRRGFSLPRIEKEVTDGFPRSFPLVGRLVCNMARANALPKSAQSTFQKTGDRGHPARLCVINDGS